MNFALLFRNITPRRIKLTPRLNVVDLVDRIPIITIYDKLCRSDVEPSFYACVGVGHGS